MAHASLSPASRLQEEVGRCPWVLGHWEAPPPSASASQPRGRDRRAGSCGAICCAGGGTRPSVCLQTRLCVREKHRSASRSAAAAASPGGGAPRRGTGMRTAERVSIRPAAPHPPPPPPPPLPPALQPHQRRPAFQLGSPSKDQRYLRLHLEHRPW